jgi:hypothetical protein
LWISNVSEGKSAADSRTSDQPDRKTRSFRKHAPAIRHTPDQLRRQDALLQCAWRSLSEAGSVIAFLNTHHEGLGGQPLHVAIHSDEGLLRVERLLGEIAPKT